jgi:hypothetical protein
VSSGIHRLARDEMEPIAHHSPSITTTHDKSSGRRAF